MCFTPDLPPARDYAQETRDTLQTQIDLAPQKYAAEAQYGPLYAKLNQQILESTMPSLLKMYQEQVSPSLSRTEAASKSIAREQEIADVSRLGPQARQAIKDMNPEQANLVDSMTRYAQQGLDAGSQLTPGQSRQATQQVRSAYADRGLIGSQRSVLDEVLGQQLSGLGMQQQRHQQATQAYGVGQSFYGDPWQQILGRPSQSFAAMQNIGAQGQSFNPGQVFNPESQYAGDIYNQDYQGQLSANIAGSSNMAGLAGAGIGLAGKIGGAGIGRGWFG